MPEVKYGELSNWDDAEISTTNDFMNLAEGNNKVRIFTKPFQFIVHWYKDVSGANRKIKCAVNNCPLCKKGVKVQVRWYIGVIDRSCAQAKILEISSQIFKGIREYNNDPDWGDVTKYDITIKRGAKGSQPLYSVIGTPNKKNLNPDERSLVETFLKRVNISKYTQPPTPEEIEEKLGGEYTTTSSTGGKNPDMSFPDTKPTISEDDFNFGDEEN